MKTSKFNILVTPEEAPNQAILYNTFHDHRLVIENKDNSIQKFFEKVDKGLALDDQEQEIAQTFLEMGILLDDNVNEKELFDHWYTEKIQNPEGLLNLTVVMTMACNLRCPYCYEKDQLDNSKHMSEESANQLVAWVKNHVRTNPIKVVEMLYYGGEPLMNKNLLFKISEEVQRFCAEYGVEYMGRMVSNGVLMTPKVSKRLREVGVEIVKITLDGDKDTHDTSRITSSGRGSFDQIFYNLEHANDDLSDSEKPLKFYIGGNFTPKTYPGFVPLLDRIANSGFKKYITSFNLKPVQDVDANPMEEFSSNPCDTVCFDELNTNRMIHLREELQKRGLPAIDGLNLGPCDFYRGDSFTVGTEGSLYPCIAFIDNESCATGHVNDQDVKESHHKKQDEWVETKPWTEDCYDCSFLPVCTGGCRATAYSNGYAWSSAVCEKDYFQRMSSALAKELLGIDPGNQEFVSEAEFEKPQNQTTHVESKKQSPCQKASAPAGFSV